jgi:tubulin--tyrosine ligase
MYNRVEGNFHLTNKKALFHNMTAYYRAINSDPFEAFPMTFHFKNVTDDIEFKRFKY